MTIVRSLLEIPRDAAVFAEAAECCAAASGRLPDGNSLWPRRARSGCKGGGADLRGQRPTVDRSINRPHPRASASGRAGDRFPPLAVRLAAKFWPGPLTLVLPKSEAVPAIVTADGPTVALRVPSDVRSQSLLRAVAAPLAAPSANRFGRISPTRAEHVLAELEGRIEMLLDGGPTGFGLESTVLDVTTTPARILRPGAVTLEELRHVDSHIQLAEGGGGVKWDEALRSPGQLPAHYAPQAELWLASGPQARELLAAECESRRAAGQRVGWLYVEEDARLAARADESILLGSEEDVGACARRLYHALRKLDDSAVAIILVRELPDRGPGRAINDRLRRAARGRALPD